MIVVAKLPQILLEHHKKLMTGVQREVNGVMVREGGEEGFEEDDLETIARLLKMNAAWIEIEETIGTNWLPRLFDALWITNRKWDDLRNVEGKNRGRLVANKLKQITGAIDKLEGLLSEFHDLTAPVGGGPARNPDAWPDSLFLRQELSSTKERCEKFHYEKMSSETFVNEALGARESGRLYLRALVAMLDEMAFSFGENRTPSKALIDLADAAAGADGAIDYDAFYSILQPERKKRSG